MNKHLQEISDFIAQNDSLSAEGKAALLKSVKDAGKEMDIMAFKLDRTDKVKRTTAILLEETIEELEQKRKAVEAQNKELEIETSLERVRTVAMSMVKTADLLNICHTQFHELKQSGFDTIRNALIGIYHDGENYFTDFDYSDFSKGNIHRIPYHQNPVVDRAFQQIKSADNAFTEFVVEGKELEEWKQFRKANGEYEDPRIDGSEKLYYYFYSIESGYMGISTFSQISETQLNILRRFRNVFDLAYKRYVDISNAEAQAREVQIELALERVRARTMAMQQSAELADTAAVLFQQIKGLGFETWSCGFCTWQKDEMVEVWMGADSGRLLSPMMIPYSKEPTHKKISEANQQGEATHEYIWKDEPLERHYDFLRNIPSAAAAIGQLEAAGLSLPDQQCYYVGFFNGGYLLLITREPNEQLKELSKRFAKVFEQTYTRFLDLQKAEAQTREAQINLAVERVRAKALAMFRSEEILDVVFKLKEEMMELDIPNVVAATIYMAEQDGSIRIRDLTSLEVADGKYHQPLDIIFQLEKSDPDFFMRKIWNNEEKYFVVTQDEDDLKITIQWLRDNDREEQAIETEALIQAGHLKKVYHPTVPLNNGRMCIDLLEPPSGEIPSILTKMAAAFNLAYKRFEDLKSSEKQIREAQIELALERVRARTMAMQHSDELGEVSFLLDSQVRSLGIQTRGCAFNIYGDHEATEWFSSERGSMPVYKTPREGLFLRYYKAGQSGIPMHIESFAGDDCKRHYEYLCTVPIMGDGLKAMIAAGGSFPEKQTDHVTYFKYGYVLFITLEPILEAQEVFIRFAKVFEQTYTRFLDLQKAEAQALQAELSLTEIKKARQKAEEALIELQATQKQLIQSEKMASLGELTAGIAHEIQNPLNFVNNFSDLSKELLDEMKTELDAGNTEDAYGILSDIIQNLEKINHHGKRADAIVKGMLQHSRSSGTAKEATDINALVDEYIRLCYHGLRSKDKSFNAAIHTDFDTNAGMMEIIPQDIGRVMLNLLNNAFYTVSDKLKSCQVEIVEAGLKYEPTVSISTKKMDDKIEIKVSDNGAGIPANILDKIVQPFFTTKPTGQGTGLGLSLSYDIIKAHEGELKIETNPGEGSVFFVYLPIK